MPWRSPPAVMVRPVCAPTIGMHADRAHGLSAGRFMPRNTISGGLEPAGQRALEVGAGPRTDDGLSRLAVLEQDHRRDREHVDRKSTRLNSSHVAISYAV